MKASRICPIALQTASGARVEAFSEQVLQLGENLFDRIEIRGILGQEEQPGTDRADSAAHDLALATAEIVHDDDVARLEGESSTRLIATSDAYLIALKYSGRERRE
jgi:hypothetical protein